LDQLFNGSKYLQAIVVDDDSITNLSYVVRPKSVKQDIIKLIDELWMPLALSKQRDDIVENIVTEINSANPTRIDCFIPDILAAGLRIVAVRYEWSYSGGNN
jgi:phage tail sheath gpL-like